MSHPESRDKTMSQHDSFVFSTTALRSLQRDEDMLERHQRQRRLASRPLTGYLLTKEARSRQLLASGTSTPPAVCEDLVTQNALYTGDLEALRQLYPKGSRANCIIEPRGGDMRWVARGDGKTSPLITAHSSSHKNRGPIRSLVHI